MNPLPLPPHHPMPQALESACDSVRPRLLCRAISLGLSLLMTPVALAQQAGTPAGVEAVATPAQAAVPARLPAPVLTPIRTRADRDEALAQAGELTRAGRTIHALSVYEHLLAADPKDDVAYRERALTLAELGASQLAADQVTAWPDVFADHQRERLQGDRAARMVTWGATFPVREDDRIAEMQAALDAIQALQRDQPRVTNWERTRLRIDSLAALNGLQRHAEVVAEYDALLSEGVDLPPYAHAQSGDSLLALRQPRRAADALQIALKGRADDVDARLLLGYAWLELERFDLAQPIFEGLAREQPAWPKAPGARLGYENWDRYKADLNLALFRSLGHDHAGAQALLGTLVNTGPYSAQTQSAYGSVLHRRVQPTAALERYDMALTLEPRHRDSLIGRVETLMDLQRMDEARVANDLVQSRFTDDRHVQRLARNVEVRRGAQGLIGASRGESEPRDGSATPASPLGTRDGRYIVEAWSPLLNDRWRVGAMGEEVHARFDADTVRYRRAGVAADYRHRDFGARVEAYSVLEDDVGDDAALRAAFDWRLGDAWSLRAGLASHDIDASLQARRAGITADAAWLGATWIPSDLTRVDAQAKQLRYDDGNDRLQVGIDARQRLYTSPHLLVDGLASVFTSSGSRDDAPYFNPDRDASAAIGLRFDHITWRHYERHFRQRLDVMAGTYRQDGFSAEFVPSVTYRHEWRFGPGSVLDYGVAWSRPVYDGRREERVALDITYRWGQ